MILRYGYLQSLYYHVIHHRATSQCASQCTSLDSNWYGFGTFISGFIVDVNV